MPVVRTQEYVVSRVMAAFTKLHDTNPTHPIFGPATKHQIQLPFERQERMPSWLSKVEDLGKEVRKSTGEFMSVGSCWLYQSDSRITACYQHGRYFELLAVHLLAFLADPTDAHWDCLTAKKHKVPGYLS